MAARGGSEITDNGGAGKPLSPAVQDQPAGRSRTDSAINNGRKWTMEERSYAGACIGQTTGTWVGQTAETPDTASAMIERRVREIADRVSRASNRIGGLGVRWHGHDLVTEAPKNGPQPVPSGAMGGILSALDDLDGIVTRLGNNVDRIETIA